MPLKTEGCECFKTKIMRMLFGFILLCILSVRGDNHNHHHHHHHEHSEHGGEHDHNDQEWFRTESLDGNGLFVLDWKVVNKDIVFRITANTRGYIGLGFSHKSEKVGDSDILLAWVDDRTGEPTVLVSNFIEYLCYCSKGNTAKW